jgi:hypothetical protein
MNIAETIANLVNAANVKVVRNGKQVQNKISHMEKQFKKAYNFANKETGSGIKEIDDGTTFT